jgi:hypothetical protein
MMYFVALQLEGKVDEASYASLKRQLETLGPWSNRFPDCWLVETNFSARRIRDLVKPHLKANDRVFVGEFNTNWAGFGMGPNFPDWMKRRTTIRRLPAGEADGT